MDLIIGAGVTGISYANFTKNDFQIVEKENEVGGYCRTIKRNGFVWDCSGHFFHFQHPEIEEYVCRNIDTKLFSWIKMSLSIVCMIFLHLGREKSHLSKKWFMLIWVSLLLKSSCCHIMRSYTHVI